MASAVARSSLQCKFTPKAAPSKCLLSTPVLSSKYAVKYHRGINRSGTAVAAMGGPGGNKKGLSREDEPEEYWTSERERKGESPFKDPIALIGLLAIFFPLIFLLVAAATGLVDLNGGR